MDEELAKEVFWEWYKKSIPGIDETSSIDDIDVESWDCYGLVVLSIDSEEYAIGTDEEADSAAEDSIRERLYAFNSEWLKSHIKPDIPIEAIRAIQEKYEDASEPLYKLLQIDDNWDWFVEESISSDGRGSFIGNYDDNEHEIIHNKEVYFVYRLN